MIDCWRAQSLASIAALTFSTPKMDEVHPFEKEAFRETADTPYHVLVECPALMGARLRLTGTIRPNSQQGRVERRSLASFAYVGLGTALVASHDFFNVDPAEWSDNDDLTPLLIGDRHIYGW
ncbi:hypothetical protein FJT64_021006 [Amphibalanus amphitrite]|uniref:Uncharacterized protein n=1 Tax=Amphibalanus amphitrite TaxID=1232801 RepID=A0A6A4WV55_AMPAM|nr:hypothetical protein FJT64_021006 [Amphibalanus amphitrite]